MTSTSAENMLLHNEEYWELLSHAAELGLNTPRDEEPLTGKAAQLHAAATFGIEATAHNTHTN